MIAFTLEALAPSRKITSGVMLVPALSPNYDLRTAVSRTERGIWNFCSYGDVFFLGVGTLLCGTTDGRHCIAAGNMGFARAVVERSRASDQLRSAMFPTGGRCSGPAIPVGICPSPLRSSRLRRSHRSSCRERSNVPGTQLSGAPGSAATDESGSFRRSS